MAWKIVNISNPAKLSFKNNQFVIQQEKTATLPIEDIDTVIIDSFGINISANLISKLAEKSTTVVFCDEKHLPNSILLPYSSYSRQAKISKLHTQIKEPLKKRLWQKIIIQKIKNQSDVLSSFSLNNTLLEKYAKEVKSGDTTNRESLAARIYFSELLEDSTRRKPTWHNAALNYGYAIIRSHIARHIAARGLVSSLGIFHRNELNAFNLADDLIEPYRPLVDIFILKKVAINHIGDEDSELNTKDKQLILDILNEYVIIDNRSFSMKFAIEKTVESFVSCLDLNTETKLILPSIK